MWLRSADVTALRDHISRWTGRPLDHLIVKDLNGDFELARKPGQTIYVRFGPRHGTISGLNPVVSSSLFARVHSTVSLPFVTDQSCLTLYAQELSTLLIESCENTRQEGA